MNVGRLYCQIYRKKQRWICAGLSKFRPFLSAIFFNFPGLLPAVPILTLFLMQIIYVEGILGHEIKGKCGLENLTIV